MYFIIGAGFWGAVIAERIASVMKEPVTIIDKRNHIGGNCHSSIDEETGIECHRYGSHIFHTSLPQVWEYINRFGEFTNYQHKVFTTYQGKVYTMPINLSTINAFYGKSLTPTEAEEFLKAEIARDFIAEPKNLEEKAISLIGRPLYEAFIKGYTAKQWEHDPKDLPASIISRLPFRSNYNANYFRDPWQGVPKGGYFSIFQKLLANPLITVKLGVEYEQFKAQIPADATVIYTGMPDQLFGYEFGELEWRSLRFEWETRDVRDYQGTACMNYADESVPYTRIHEFKHYHPERETPFNFGRTVICREYSQTYKRGEEAYYPVNNERNNAVYARYAQKAAETPNLILGGRLGSYRYWDMDKAIADALNTFETKILPA
ncbi:MAG: UDP-galactopyranose mutase [Deltaproteobacteria bacterium]|nr:UDP-galactopyranose mutase [Deltaproteobacteria bacterium]